MSAVARHSMSLGDNVDETVGAVVDLTQIEGY